jgi:uncharacterized protein YceK
VRAVFGAMPVLPVPRRAEDCAPYLWGCEFVRGYAIYLKIDGGTNLISKACSGTPGANKHIIFLTMKRPIALTFIVVSLCSLCSGCGTIDSLAEQGAAGKAARTPYGGVRLDFRFLTHNAKECPSTYGCSLCYVAYDLPFSAIADTLLLPVNLINVTANLDKSKTQQ